MTALTIDSSSPVFDLPPLERALLASPLHVMGDVSLLHAARRVAVVGNRAATTEGLRRAHRLARELVAHGAVVVSGLAAGIDTAAHQSAIASGGRTIAVLGTPLDKVYPSDNGALQRRIGAQHLLVSEFKPRTKIQPTNFTERNRTMALLSHASVIVECMDTSGTLSHAGEALKLGRPVFVLRSAAENPTLRWAGWLISKGARVLDRTEQVMQAIEHAGR